MLLQKSFELVLFKHIHLQTHIIIYRQYIHMYIQARL